VSESGWFRSAFCGGKQGDYTVTTVTPRIVHRAVYAADGTELYGYRANSTLSNAWTFHLDLPAGAKLVLTDAATGLKKEVARK